MSMTVYYNGVEIKVSRVVLFDRRPVYGEDDTQILYDHWRIGVVGVVHPAAMALPAGTQPGRPFPTVPFAGLDRPPSVLTSPAGQSAGQTLPALGNALLTDRAQLRVTYGTADGTFGGAPNVILESPRRNPPGTTNRRWFTVDARNGPHPVAFNVMEVHGARTLVVYFEVETWQQKCTKYPRSVLYHRWEAEHEIDAQYLTTRRVSGRAIFSAEMLNDQTPANANQAPDDFRSTLFHAVPVGMQRKGVKVTADTDGLGVRYAFEDVEQVTNLRLAKGRGVVELSGHHRSGHDTIQSNLPVRWVEFEARAVGLRTTTRQQLVSALVDVAAAYAFRRPFNAGWWESSVLDVDVVGKEASLHMRVQVAGGLVGLGQDLFGNAAVGGVSFATGLNGANNFLENLTTWATNEPSQCVRPPNDDGCRGTHLERLVAQVLVGDCDFPPTVWKGPLPSYDDNTVNPIDIWTWGDQ